MASQASTRGDVCVPKFACPPLQANRGIFQRPRPPVVGVRQATGRRHLLTRASSEGAAVDEYEEFSRRPNPLPEITPTNILLGINILIFGLNYWSHDALVLLGCKDNALIAAGQAWRLMTPVFLHKSILHLAVNCQALSVLGPLVQSISGNKRFFLVYLVSGLTGSIASYVFNPRPAIGASGAIFGLSGALLCFALRHKSIPQLEPFCGMLQRNILQTLAINTVFGLASGGIDNWGHGGGFVGGLVIAALVGPALVQTRGEISEDGESIELEPIRLEDRPPLPFFRFSDRKRDEL